MDHLAPSLWCHLLTNTVSESDSILQRMWTTSRLRERWHRRCHFSKRHRCMVNDRNSTTDLMIWMLCHQTYELSFRDRQATWWCWNDGNLRVMVLVVARHAQSHTPGPLLAELPDDEAAVIYLSLQNLYWICIYTTLAGQDLSWRLRNFDHCQIIIHKIDEQQ